MILVEGRTDELALTLAARRLGLDLNAEGVRILGTNGAHGMGRLVSQVASEVPTAKMAGLYDAGEEAVVRVALERAGLGDRLARGQLEGIGFFACVVDLEDELTRAAGQTLLARLIELEGDAQAWRKFRTQRAWQDRPFDQQFRRFIRSVHDRNSRYIRAIVETIDPSQLPRPLRLLLDHVTAWPAN